MSENQPMTYEQSGVRYSDLDAFKRAAQEAARSTAQNLERFGYHEIPQSRGESAFVWDEGRSYRVMVTEGLGTKNLVADATSALCNRAYYFKIAQDTLAMIFNDLGSVGDAEPQVVTAHFSVGNSNWFTDPAFPDRTADLINGWAYTCNLAGATWGGGETPALKDIVEDGKIELSGTAVGEIRNKERLTLGDKLAPGDAIVLLGSTGIHANGLTLARTIADQLPNGYATRLSDGTYYGDALLQPTPVYTPLIHQLFEAGIDIHYMSNITGHGWRKLMRADKELSYIIDAIPRHQPVFDFIQEQSHNDDAEMYGNFNMGAGFVLFVNKEHVYAALQVAAQHGVLAMCAGRVEAGPKQVIIEPKNGLTFSGSSLAVR